MIKHKNKIITDEKQLTKLFISYYINIAEKGMVLNQKPFTSILKTPVYRQLDILNSYKNHTSTVKIKQVVNRSDVSDSKRFSFKNDQSN